ncbi:hypothetical protein SpCBS45565_g08265 [Spizellomyces sp. 'palustris']|nr:hypothetical protein SpCBS45565_g08265 [Spizellomyces sp. 'palustris']
MTANDEETWANWQGDLAPELKQKATFKDLVFPGSHDAGAYGPADLVHTSENKPIPFVLPYLRWLPGIRDLVEGITRMQETDIKSQLLHGGRYFDLRFARPNGLNELHVAHAVAYQSAVAVLEQIQTFLERHPTEILLLLLRNAYTQNTDTAEIAKLVLSYVKPFVHRNLAHHKTYASVSEMIAKNERVILVYEGARAEDDTIRNSDWWWQAEELFSWTWIVNNGDWKERTDWMVEHCRRWKSEFGSWDAARHNDPRTPKKMLIWSHEISLNGGVAVRNHLRQRWFGGRNPTDPSQMTFRQHADHYNRLFRGHFLETSPFIPPDLRDDIGIVHVDFEWEVYRQVMEYTIKTMTARFLEIRKRSGPVYG